MKTLKIKKNFKETEEYKKIRNELSFLSILESKASFACYSDNVFTYVISDNGLSHEFSFTCDDTLLKDMVVSEILELDGIWYFRHSIYLDNGKELELGAEVTRTSLPKDNGLLVGQDVIPLTVGDNVIPLTFSDKNLT